MERTINQEQTENPALEVTEQRICLFCSNPLYGPKCTVCGHSVQAEPQERLDGRYDIAEPPWRQQQVFYDIDDYSSSAADYDNEFDPLTQLASVETLAEELLLQLQALISPQDAPIAEQLVGNLNERGYLDISVEEIATLLRVPPERVEYVLSQLQTLEPFGIGARNPRECLLIQLQALSEQNQPHTLAFILIDQHLKQLGHNQFQEIARQLKVTEQEVRQGYAYIRSTLHPYPAYMYRSQGASMGSDAVYIRPDVIIRKGENGFEVELMEEKRYKIRVETDYHDSARQSAVGPVNSDIQRYMYPHRMRARFFVDCINRRWRTLKRVTEFVVERQQAFLEKGVRYLQPLTRAEVAEHLGLDEGTVSRTAANKYALLPSGRLMPISDFFDGSLRIKDMLRELIQTEMPRHRYSDEELARHLTALGFPLARRTITKYREEMGLGSSRERG
ncbi:MAG: RNA polymerase factor sigma-54 [Ktedonobacteraceae bacterium]